MYESLTSRCQFNPEIVNPFFFSSGLMICFTTASRFSVGFMLSSPSHQRQFQPAYKLFFFFHELTSSLFPFQNTPLFRTPLSVLSSHPAGPPVSDGIIRNISRDDAPGPDHYIISNRHPRHYDSPAADPYVVSDHYFIVIQKRTIHIYFAVVSKINIISIVCIERCRNPQIFSFSRLPYIVPQIWNNSISCLKFSSSHPAVGYSKVIARITSCSSSISPR